MRSTQTLLLAWLAAACGGGDPTASPADAGAVPDAPGPDAAPPLTGVVDLRADVDRDGVVELDDPGDDEGEDGWSATRGAIFLANIDDDAGRCPPEMYPAVTPDEVLAACNDAQDEVVDGD